MVRYKNRYLTIQVSTRDDSDKPLNLQTNALHNAIQRKVSEMYGDLGSAAIKAGFTAKYCNPITRIALIKTRHGPHMFLQNAVPKINDVGGRLVSIQILYIGATIKHCFLFIKKYQTKKLESMWKGMKNKKERKELEEALMQMLPAAKDLL